jgi:hypothetical protein
MLNAVKHLYRLVERMLNNVTEILHCIQCEHRLSLTSGFQYAVSLLCLLSVSISQAQTYSLETLEGINTSIKIQNRTTSIPFTISCSTDKLTLPNYWADGETKVLNRKFLKVRYYVRGGSGVGIGNTLLLCISHGKLRQALHIESYSSNLNHPSNLDYKGTTQRILDTQLTLDAANNVYAVTYDTLVSGENRDFQRRSLGSKRNTLRFNLHENVFFSYQKKVNTNLITFRGSRTNIGHFSGVAPAFQLNDTEYLFISSRWYAKSSNKGEYILVD